MHAAFSEQASSSGTYLHPATLRPLPRSFPLSPLHSSLTLEGPVPAPGDSLLV